DGPPGMPVQGEGQLIIVSELDTGVHRSNRLNNFTILGLDLNGILRIAGVKVDRRYSVIDCHMLLRGRILSASFRLIGRKGKTNSGCRFPVVGCRLSGKNRLLPRESAAHQ